MTRQTILTTAGAAAAVALTATAAVGITAATGQTATDSATTLTLQSRFDARSLVTHPAQPKSKGYHAGDVISFAAELRKDGQAYGRMVGTQIAADERYRAISSHYSLLLPDGTIEILGAATDKRVTGLPAPKDDDPAAVVGGTGAYEGAHGSFTLSVDGRTITVRYTK